MSRDDEIRERLRALKVFQGDLPTFDVDQAPPDPTELFHEWLQTALDAEIQEPHAMTLSTVDPAGRPTSRVLILKGLDDGRWHFASSAASRKGKEIAANPWAAANFYWPELGRQVRLRGRVLDAGPDAAARDFLARPPGSRAETLAGHQSAPLHDPADLDQALTEAHARIQADPDLVDEHWTVYQLAPDEIEFWQAHPERRHTRLQYRLDNARWTRHTIWP